MLEPPDIELARIVEIVRLRFGIGLSGLEFLPLGQDVRSWAFRAAGGTSYFLKLRGGPLNEAALRVPRFLAEHGVTHVVAPLPARDGRPWCEIDGYTLALYPFVEGGTSMQYDLQERHWIAYGAALREIHDTPPDDAIAGYLVRETFCSRWPGVVQALDEALTAGTLIDPIQHELAASWQIRREAIHALVERFQALGRRLREAPPPFVICHADAHLNNILVDREEKLWVVDWDDVLLAPKEADLMMGVGGLGGAYSGPREAAWFLRGYGSDAIDADALAYYRYYRAVSDIACTCEQVIVTPETSRAGRRRALERFERLFALGHIVALINDTRGGDH